MNKSVKFWDRIAHQWSQQENELDQDSIKLIEWSKEHLDVDDIVLDYGCGTGTIANELAAYVKEVHAIDISSKMIEVAQKRSGERRIENVNFAQSTLFDEQHKKEMFNVVMAFNILHLLEDTPKALRRIHEILKPGGSFISTTACLGEKGSCLGIILFPLSKIGLIPYLDLLKISELETSITNASFQIIETDYLHQTPTNYFIVAKKI